MITLLRSWLCWLVGAAGSVLCLLAGHGHLWTRLVGGAAVGVGIALEIALLGLVWRDGSQQLFWVRGAPAATLTLGVDSWWWVNQQGQPAVTSSIDPVLIPVGAIPLLVAAFWLDRRLPAAHDALLLARNLPGAPQVSPSLSRRGCAWAAVVLCGVQVIGFAGGALALPLPAMLVLSLLAIVAIAIAHAGCWSLRQHNRQVAAALRALAPVFALPYNGSATFHIGMWTPYVERAGRPIIVVTTRDVTFERVPAAYSLPVLYAPSGTQNAVAAMFPATLRAAFYVFNGSNRAFLRQPNVRHVFLQHGDSDKGIRTNPQTALYDTIVVPGQAAIDRFRQRGLTISADRFVVVGRPQTAEISTTERAIATVPNPVVLYAPTWKGKREEYNYSSLLVGPMIVAALLARGATVIFRPHPAGRSHRPHVRAIAKIQKMLVADAKRTGRRHRWGVEAESPTVAEVSNLSDAMIADVSGIVTDYMQSLKPFAMVATRTDAKAFRKQFPTSQAAYVIEGDLSNLDATLNELLGSDPLAPLRVERRRYYLGDFDNDESVQAFTAFIEELAESGQPAARV